MKRPCHYIIEVKLLWNKLIRPQTKDVVDSYEKLTGYFDLEGFHFNNVFLYARLKMVRIMWLGMAGVHTGFRTIALVLSIGSLPNLATWFPCGRGRTLFLEGY